MVIFESPIYQQMLEDARQTYPDECCGFLFGREDGDTRILSNIQVVNNAKEGDKRRRFEITPKDYLKAERFALENGLELLSVYHSHPNHPAVPSEHDRVAALPFFSYVIVSVYDRDRINTQSWRLNEARQFEAEHIQEHSFV